MRCAWRVSHAALVSLRAAAPGRGGRPPKTARRWRRASGAAKRRPLDMQNVRQAQGLRADGGSWQGLPGWHLFMPALRTNANPANCRDYRNT